MRGFLTHLWASGFLADCPMVWASYCVGGFLKKKNKKGHFSLSLQNCLFTAKTPHPTCLEQKDSVTGKRRDVSWLGAAQWLHVVALAEAGTRLVSQGALQRGAWTGPGCRDQLLASASWQHAEPSWPRGSFGCGQSRRAALSLAHCHRCPSAVRRAVKSFAVLNCFLCFLSRWQPFRVLSMEIKWTCFLFAKK